MVSWWSKEIIEGFVSVGGGLPWMGQGKGDCRTVSETEEIGGKVERTEG